MKTIKLSSVVTIALLSIAGAYLYSRSRMLSLFYTNAPNNLKRINNVKNLDIKFPGVVRNCEDVLLDTEQAFALLSCNPGRDSWNTVMGIFYEAAAPPETGLYMWHYADDDLSPPEKLKLLDFNVRPEDFHPLGIEYHAPSRTLFVVNHAESGSRIDIFQLFPSERAATHIRTIEHSALAAPNSVAAISGTQFFVTNDHYFRRRYYGVLALLETYLGIPGGSVVFVDLHSLTSESQPTMKKMAQLCFANGVVLLNRTTLAVASSTTASVNLYTVVQSGDQGTPQSLKYAMSIPVQFIPDNLSVDSDGKLLIAGHPHAPTLEAMAKNSHRCNARGDEDKRGCELKGLSWFSEWSRENGLKDLYAGDDFGSATTAVRDTVRHVGVAGGLYARGILTWQE